VSLTDALDALDGAAIARDVSRLVQERSITGRERCAAARVVGLARELGLRATLDVHDLDALRAIPGPARSRPAACMAAARST